MACLQELFATNLAHGRTIFKFDQSKMNHHLCACFEVSELIVFPY